MANAVKILWTDAELAEAVETYLFLLRAERAGVARLKDPTASIQTAGSLPRRNDASIRYRMRNISAVIAELGGPVLAAYPPADKVGTNVALRLRAMLATHVSFQEILEDGRTPSISGDLDPRAEALTKLETLRRYLEDLQAESVWIGHNHPPEDPEPTGLSSAELAEARNDVVALEIELVQPLPDAAATEAHADRLRDFGIRVSAWLGQRATKFVDAALIALAPALVAKMTGLLPLLIDALSAVARAAPH